MLDWLFQEKIRSNIKCFFLKESFLHMELRTFYTEQKSFFFYLFHCKINALIEIFVYFFFFFFITSLEKLKISTSYKKKKISKMINLLNVCLL